MRGRRATAPARRPRARPTRRVSGPSAGASAGALALAGSAVALPPKARPALRPAAAPRIPRRPRTSSPRRAAAHNPQRTDDRVSEALGALTRVADHGLLDRLIRGRLWIGLVAFALIGIVAMQLVVLRLNTEVGKGLERKANLQREISSLQVAMSTLTAAEHVQSEAQRHGMQAATSDVSQFLTTNPADVASAARLLAGSGPGEQSAHSQEAGASAHSGEAGEAHGTESAGASSHEAEHAAGNEAASASSHEAEAPAGQAASGAGGPGASATQSAETSETQGSEASGASAASGSSGEANGGAAAGQEAPHG
jgi:hypothetical protein